MSEKKLGRDFLRPNSITVVILQAIADSAFYSPKDSNVMPYRLRSSYYVVYIV